jgi:hypothetical protein
MGTHPEVDAALERLIQQIQQTAGGNLLGIALYGGLVKGRFTPGVSDINVLIVLAEASLASLLPLAPVLTGALRDTHVVPFVATHQDLQASALLFPFKLLDMKLWHRTLWGDPHLEEIEIQPEALRLRALQEIKNLQLGMRLRIVERHGDPDALWRGLVRSIPKLAARLEILMRARKVDMPTDRAGILREAIRQLGVSSEQAPERVERLAGLRRSEKRPDEAMVRQLLDDYLELLEEICHRVEGELLG